MQVGLNLTYVHCNLTAQGRKPLLSQRTVLRLCERDVAIFIVYLETVAVLEHLGVNEQTDSDEVVQQMSGCVWGHDIFLLTILMWINYKLRVCVLLWKDLKAPRGGCYGEFG